MISDEDKLVYILTKPELKDWSKCTWNDMWENYLEDCAEMAKENNETIDVILQDYAFMEWYENFQEDEEFNYQQMTK